MEQKINIRIGDHSYEMRVKSPEHEQLIRDAANMLNKSISSYQAKYAQNDMLDILSFVALRQSMNNLLLQKDMGGMKDECDELEAVLKSYLANIEN